MSVVSPTEQMEALTLGQTGLSIDRWLDPTVAAPLQEDLYLEFPEIVKVRPRIGVNLLDFDDVRNQVPLHDVSAEGAQRAVGRHVTSLANRASVRLTNIHIPNIPGKHRSVILARVSQVRGTAFTTERNDSIKALQSLADIRNAEAYNWRSKSIAMVIGNILSDATEMQRSNVKRLVANNLHGILGLEAALVQTGNPERRIPRSQG